MKVRLLRDARVLVPAGTQMEIADEGARQLVSLGSAVEIKRETPEAPKTEAPKVEKVERKPQKETKKG